MKGIDLDVSVLIIKSCREYVKGRGLTVNLHPRLLHLKIAISVMQQIQMRAIPQAVVSVVAVVVIVVIFTDVNIENPLPDHVQVTPPLNLTGNNLSWTNLNKLHLVDQGSELFGS